MEWKQGTEDTHPGLAGPGESGDREPPREGVWSKGLPFASREAGFGLCSFTSRASGGRTNSALCKLWTGSRASPKAIARRDRIPGGCAADPACAGGRAQPLPRFQQAERDSADCNLRNKFGLRDSLKATPSRSASPRSWRGRAFTPSPANAHSSRTWPANGNYAVECRKPAFETRAQTVNHSIGAGWIILDILEGFIPLIVDAATGSWNQLESTTVRCSLEVAEVPTQPRVPQRRVGPTASSR
jgi:hypothetical protein